MNILVINGPNLNFLGIREPDIYGTNTYMDLEAYLLNLAKEYNVRLDIFQSNHEGALIDKIQEVYFRKFDGIIMNAGAYSHYSYAIRDAINSVNIRTVEVHLSNIMEREEFRKHSVIKDVCINSFMGKGFESYAEALRFLVGK